MESQTARMAYLRTELMKTIYPFGIFRMPHTSYAGGIIIEFLTVRMTIFT